MYFTHPVSYIPYLQEPVLIPVLNQMSPIHTHRVRLKSISISPTLYALAFQAFPLLQILPQNSCRHFRSYRTIFIPYFLADHINNVWQWVQIISFLLHNTCMVFKNVLSNLYSFVYRWNLFSLRTNDMCVQDTGSFKRSGRSEKCILKEI
jgi:hypothetical protein